MLNTASVPRRLRLAPSHPALSLRGVRVRSGVVEQRARRRLKCASELLDGRPKSPWRKVSALDSIHPIQEAHATLVHLSWDMVHVALGEEDVL